MSQRVFTSRGGSAAPTPSALKWQVKAGQLHRIARAAYVSGEQPPTDLERALAQAAAARGVVSEFVAGALLGLDVPPITKPSFIVPPTASGRRTGARRYAPPPERVVWIDGVPVTDGLQTFVDLAAHVDDLVCEQVLESVLRLRLTTIEAIESMLPSLSRSRTKGVGRIRRVLALRPPGAPPTDSLLETLMVQLARSVGAPTPTRQLELYDEYDQFVARPDLCWPELGVFLELDGEHHKGQPLYDANRETRVVAAKGWMCGRFTWTEVRFHPKPTGRRLLRVLEQARLRPIPVRLQP